MLAENHVNGVYPMNERQCSAHNRSGRQCGRAPIVGGTVCNLHGGKAPQVRAKAEERIRQIAVSKAMPRIESLIDHGESDTIRLAAARDIMDRAGFGAKQRLEHSGEMTFSLRIDRGDSEPDE